MESTIERIIGGFTVTQCPAGLIRDSPIILLENVVTLYLRPERSNSIRPAVLEAAT